MAAVNSPIKSFNLPGTLHNKTLELLKNDVRSIAQVAADSGISFYWLQGFSQNNFKNPSVNRIQYLYEHLSKKQLKV